MTTPLVETLSVNASQQPAVVTKLFRDEGVVALRGILPPAVCSSVIDFLKGAIDDLSIVFSQYGISIEAPAAGKQVQQLLDRDGKSIPSEDRHILLGHFPLSVRLNEALWAIPLHLASRPFLCEMLGCRKLFVHMPPTARFVLPGNVKAAVPAHQDVSYNKHLGSFCVVWVPLVEIDELCGGMAVYPKTQGLGELYNGSSVAAADGWIPGIETKSFDRVALFPLSVGDIVVMGDELVHESMPNTSDRIRLSIDFRFFGDNSGSSKHYLDLQERKVIAPSQ